MAANIWNILLLSCSPFGSVLTSVCNFCCQMSTLDEVGALMKGKTLFCNIVNAVLQFLCQNAQNPISASVHVNKWIRAAGRTHRLRQKQAPPQGHQRVAVPAHAPAAAEQPDSPERDTNAAATAPTSIDASAEATPMADSQLEQMEPSPPSEPCTPNKAKPPPISVQMADGTRCWVRGCYLENTRRWRWQLSTQSNRCTSSSRQSYSHALAQWIADHGAQLRQESIQDLRAAQALLPGHDSLQVPTPRSTRISRAPTRRRDHDPPMTPQSEPPPEPSAWQLPSQESLDRLSRMRPAQLLSHHIPIMKHLPTRLLHDIAAHLRWLLEQSFQPTHNEATRTACLTTFLLAPRLLWAEPQRQGSRLPPYARINHVKAKLTSLRAGQWDVLYQALHERDVPAPTASRPSVPGVLTPVSAGRIAAAVKSGNLSSAWKQLWNHGVASPDEDEETATVIQQLWGLDNPFQPRPQVSPITAAAAQLLVNAGSVRKALQHFQPGKAADALGWNQHTWAQLAAWPTLQDHVPLLLDHLLRDKLPRAVTNLALASRLIPLHKATAGTLRPIAIPTVFRKTLSSICYERWLPQARAFVGNDQHGVGVCQGTAIMAQKVSQYLATSDQTIAVSLDVTNAFGTIARSTVVQGLRTVDQDLANSQTTWLQASSLGILNNAPEPHCCHWTSTGIPQGDPLSAMAFACALETVFREFRAKLAERGQFHVRTPCYVDDVVLLTNRDEVDTVFAVFVEVAAAHNLTINTSKTRIFTTHPDGPMPGPLRDLWSQQPRHDGITIGGLPLESAEAHEESIPIGSDSYVQAFLAEKLRSYKRCCDVLLQLPETLEESGVGTHVAFVLLRASVAAKPVHLLAALHPQHTTSFAEQLDTVTTGTLCALLRNPLLGLDQLALLRRPVRAGGFGFPAFLREFPMLRVHHLLLNAHTASGSTGEGMRPEPALLHEALSDCKDKANMDVPKILSQSYQTLVEDGYKGALRRLRRWHYDLHLMPLQEQRRNIAMTSWLVAPQGTFVADKVWQTNMRTRLHLPVCLMTQPCRYIHTTTNRQCGAAVDEWGRHAQNCARQPVQTRHHVLRNLWADLAKSAGWHAALEQEVQLTAGRKRADLLLTSPAGTRQALDITVVHPCGETPQAAAASARQRKERQYLGDLPTLRLPGGEDFVPIVHVAGGYLEDAGLKLAEQLCTDLAAKMVNLQGQTVPVAKHNARHRIYGGLMRALAQHEVRVLEASAALL